ncbi:hypothetical protein BN1708_018259, partial [Verticillium longisporum]
GNRRPRICRLERRCPGHHHGPHLPDARRPARRDQALPHPDQEPLRRQPDPPPGPRAPRLRRLRPRHHRGGRHYRRDGRQLPRPRHHAAQARRRHRPPQVHLDPPRPVGRQARRRLSLHRRLR